jgi:hypothetical protein
MTLARTSSRILFFASDFSSLIALSSALVFISPSL